MSAIKVKAPYQFIPILPSLDTATPSLSMPMRLPPSPPSPTPSLSPTLSYSPPRPTPDYTRLHRAAKTKLRSRSNRDLRVMLCHAQLVETTEKEMQRAAREEQFWHQKRLATAKALEQVRMEEWTQRIEGDAKQVNAWIAAASFDKVAGDAEEMNPADFEEEYMYRVW